MKTRRILLCMIMTVCVVLTGCGGKSGNSSNKENATSESDENKKKSEITGSEEEAKESQNDDTDEMNDEVKVNQIYMGTYSVAAIAENGELYMWGINKSGIIGTGQQEGNQYTPAKIMDNVESVVLNNNRTAALTKKHELYIWGKNNDNTISNEIGGEYMTTPYMVMEDVKEVQLLDVHTVALTVDNELYIWGKNIEGKEKIMDNVETILCYPDKRYGDLATYTKFCVLTTDGQYYEWEYTDWKTGNGEHKEPKQRFKEINNIEKILDSDWMMLSNGTKMLNSNWIMTSDGTIYKSLGIDEETSVDVIMDNVKDYQKVNSLCTLILDRNDNLYIFGSGSEMNNLVPEKGNNIAAEDKELVLENVEDFSIMNSSNISDGYEKSIAVKTKDGNLRIIERIVYQDNNTSNRIDHIEYEDIGENVEDYKITKGSILSYGEYFREMSKVTGNNSFILVLDSNQNLYYHYYIYDGDLTDYEMTAETKIVGENVEYFAENDFVVMTINTDGELYVWGSSNEGKLGLGEDVDLANEPTKIEFVTQ